MVSRIAFISTAHIHTQGFVENILDAPGDRRLHAVWDDQPARGQRYADQAGARFEPDLDALLGDPEVDGFVICAENTRHLQLLQKAIPVGKPVFCEKPLVTDPAELGHVDALLRAYPTRVFCGYFKPFAGPMLAVQEALDAGKLGEPLWAQFRFAHRGALARWFDDPDLRWFTEPALSGGGALMDLGAHVVHALGWYFGAVERVWAQAENLSGIYPEVEDHAQVHLQFQSGVRALAGASWVHTAGENALEIQGTQGGIVATPEAATFTDLEGRTEALAAAELPTRIDRLVAEIQGRYPESAAQRDWAATVQAVRVVAAARASAPTGQWVELN